MIAQLLDRIIAFAARDEAELLRAREEWFERAGRVFDDDPLYEERTTAFLEWYALERPLPDGKLWAERFAASEPIEDERERNWVRALGRTHRSLFQVREVREGALLIDDLIAGGVFEVTERRRLPGLEQGELFEARLVASPLAPLEVLFTRAFQFHPGEAREELKRQAEKSRKAGEPRAEVLFRFLRQRLKAIRYQHVAADKIYRDAE